MDVTRIAAIAKATVPPTVTPPAVTPVPRLAAPPAVAPVPRLAAPPAVTPMPRPVAPPAIAPAPRPVALPAMAPLSPAITPPAPAPAVGPPPPVGPRPPVGPPPEYSWMEKSYNILLYNIKEAFNKVFDIVSTPPQITIVVPPVAAAPPVVPKVITEPPVLKAPELPKAAAPKPIGPVGMKPEIPKTIAPGLKRPLRTNKDIEMLEEMERKRLETKILNQGAVGPGALNTAALTGMLTGITMLPAGIPGLPPPAPEVVMPEPAAEVAQRSMPVPAADILSHTVGETPAGAGQFESAAIVELLQAILAKVVGEGTVATAGEKIVSAIGELNTGPAPIVPANLGSDMTVWH